MKSLSKDSTVSSSEDTCVKSEQTDVSNLYGNHEDDTAPDCSGIRFIATVSPLNPHSVTPSDECKLAKTFPWIIEFSRRCRAEIGLSDIHVIENLMTIYLHHVSSSVVDCYLRPNRAAKLKRVMNDTLLLFHLFYSDIKKPLEHSLYLDKMSDLMAMYIDMEITASRRSKESLFKIASKLTTALFIFLDRSQDHILDTIFKTKYINRNFWELCNLIFSRVLRDSPGRAVYEITYVRYILAFKMWKLVLRKGDERRNVMILASKRLHPPSQFRERLKAGMLSGLLPKIPKSREDITMFLMQAKFCIKEKTKAFLKAVSDPKQQDVLMADLDRPLFFIHDTETSRPDDQEESSGSTMLMNDIWSSLSVESGVAHQIRLASVLKGKKMKNKTKKTKCKGIATPVFKNEGQTDDFKKKRKKSKQGELIKSVKPLPMTSLSESCANASNVTRVRPRVETQEPPKVQDDTVESCDSIKVENIKEEPDLDEGKNVDRVNQVDSVFSGGEESSVQGEGKRACEPWKDRRCGLLDSMSLRGETSSHDSNQELIKEMLVSLQKQGRYPKQQAKVLKERKDPEPKPLTELPKQVKSLLHNQTLRRDFTMFLSQQKCRSYYVNHHSMPPGTIIRSPEDSEEPRCLCFQCSANRNALVTNYKILAYYTENKLNSSEDCSEKNEESSSCLPLKKRKNIPVEKEEECYPGTPMMSIAMIEGSRSQLSSSPLESSSSCQTATNGTERKKEEDYYPGTPMMSIAMIEGNRSQFSSSPLESSSSCQTASNGTERKKEEVCYPGNSLASPSVDCDALSAGLVPLAFNTSYAKLTDSQSEKSALEEEILLAEMALTDSWMDDITL